MESTRGSWRCWAINLCHCRTDSSGMFSVNKIPHPDALQRNLADAAQRVGGQQIGCSLPILPHLPNRTKYLHSTDSPLPPQKHHTPSRPQTCRVGYLFSLQTRQEMWFKLWNHTMCLPHPHPPTPHSMICIKPAIMLFTSCHHEEGYHLDECALRSLMWESHLLGFFQPGLTAPNMMP